MVGDQHHVARRKIRVDAARGVGHDQDFDLERLHHAHRQCDLRHAVAFVIMDAPLHNEDRLAFQFANDQLAAMPGHRGKRPMREFTKRYNLSVFHRRGQRVQAGTKNQPHTRNNIEAGANHCRHFLDLIQGNIFRHCDSCSRIFTTKAVGKRAPRQRTFRAAKIISEIPR